LIPALVRHGEIIAAALKKQVLANRNQARVNLQFERTVNRKELRG